MSSLLSLRLYLVTLTMSLDFTFILINPPSPTNNICVEWRTAINEMLPEELRGNFTVIEGFLEDIPTEQLACDCVVSPANSYGIMDGGYVDPTIELIDGIDCSFEDTI